MDDLCIKKKGTGQGYPTTSFTKCQWVCNNYSGKSGISFFRENGVGPCRSKVK